MAYTRQEIAVYETIRYHSVAARIILTVFLGVVLLVLKAFGLLAVAWWWAVAPFAWAVVVQFLGTCLHVAMLKNSNSKPNA